MASPHYTVRRAVESDVAQIHEIYASYAVDSIVTFAYEAPTVEQMTQRFRDAQGRYPWLVAVVPASATASSAAAPSAPEVVVGYCYLAVFRDRPGWRYTTEDSIYIRQGWHRQGLGRALLTALIQSAAAYGYRSIMAAISYDRSTDEGAASIALHASLGFREVGRIRDAGWKNDKWLDNVFMQCDLAPVGGAGARSAGGAAAVEGAHSGAVPPAREPGEPPATSATSNSA